MLINTSGPSTNPFPAHNPHDIDTIRQDAENNSINLGATPQSPIQFQNTLISIPDAAKAVENQPQSLLSKMVQWFTRVILMRGAAEEQQDKTGVQHAAISEIPLEEPMTITNEMVNSLAKDFQSLFVKTKNIEQEVEELFQGNSEPVDHLYNILVKMMHTHHKNTAEDRKIKTENLLNQHDELAVLQQKRKDLNTDVVAIQKNQQFWSRVNTGCSAALGLLTLAGLVATAAGGAPVALIALQAGAMVSSGTAQMVNAGVKKASNTLTGEFITTKEDMRVTNDHIDLHTKLLNDGHRALVKVIKNLRQLNDKQNELIMSLTDMRNSR